MKKLNLYAPVPVLLLALAGCATVDPQPSFDRVAADVADRSGHTITWTVDPADQAAARNLLTEELTLDNAVRLALISSPELQAQYQDLGIAEAAFVQAGLLSNPVFDVGYREGGGESNFDLLLSFDFLDVFLIPVRKRQAAADQRAAELRVTRAVLARVSEVRQAWIDAVAARQRTAYMETGQHLLAALDGFAEALLQAGNITRLERDRAHRRMLENQMLLEQARVDEAAAADRLAVAMGTWGSIEFDLPDTLPELPGKELSTASLEQMAVDRSLELAVVRDQIESVAASLDLVDRTRLVPTLEVGWLAEREGGHWSDGPAVAFALPVLDTGKARTV
ncbi:MAG: TolC family protein, partial [Xanthomonadales bacterium]|nr:TolC family protein [Xanthomonadales bacterium]